MEAGRFISPIQKTIRLNFLLKPKLYGSPIATIPMDMEQPFQQLMDETDALVHQYPESESWQQWRDRFSKTMAG